VNKAEQFNLSTQVGKVFTPATPVGEETLFAGRWKQLRKVIDTINQPGQHALIFGERGVGKTSLANVISAKLKAPNTNILAPKVNCDSGDDYASLWRKILSQLDLIQNAPTIGFQMQIFEQSSRAAKIIGDDVTPDSIRRMLTVLAGSGIIILIFDEFDRVADQDARRAMADTIKALSDNGVPVTVVIVGVADSVSQLIAEHESIERALVQIQMPRMSKAELKEILENGTERIEMTIDEDAKAHIAVLSQGLPHYTHLLGRHSALAAIEDSRKNISCADVDTAIKQALGDVQQSLRDSYHRAIFSPRKDTIYAQVLLACALSPTNELGWFTPASVREPLSRIMHKRYEIPGFARHLKDFSEPGRQVLQKDGVKRKFRFRFRNPLMQPLIIMKGIADGHITSADLKETN
jgi:Cdc6-like AAA superfamily ATPase